MNFLRAVALTWMAFTVAGACQAQSPYELRKQREWMLIGAGAAAGVAGFAVIENIAPLTVEEIAALDVEDVNQFDRKWIAPYRETHAGDGLVAASYFLPFSLLAYRDTRHDWKTLGVMWVEVTLINLGINALVKGLTTRTRPYVYDPGTPVERKTEVDARLSFYSGHTSSSAANSFFVAKVLSDYLESGLAKAAIWSAAALYPALTGYLRRDSGHHFRTDVIGGYVAGALVGYLVPELHRSRSGGDVSLYPIHVMGRSGVGLRVEF